MSNTRCESFHWMTPVYVICIALGLWLPSLERFMLYFLFIVTTLSHWHYGASVVNQMCEHFNRICFSVHMRKPSEISSTTTSSLKANGDKLTTINSTSSNSSILTESSTKKLE